MLAKFFVLMALSAFAATPVGSHCSSRYSSLIGKSGARSGRKKNLTASLASLYDFIWQFSQPSVPWKIKAQDNVFLGKGSSYLNLAAEGLIKIAIPIPLPSLSKGELQKIFLKQWVNPSYAASAIELRLLKEAGVADAFIKRGIFLRSYPKAVMAKKDALLAVRGISLAGLAAALVQADELTRNTYQVNDFLDLPSEDDEGKMVVQLLVESPVPHTAIRIGNWVYSYGQSQLKVSNIGDYLNSGEETLSASDGSQSSQGSKNTGEFGAESSTTPKISSAQSHSQSGMSRITARSVRVTNLKLTTDETRALRRDLVSHSDKLYLRINMVNDCATMIARALERNSSLSIPVEIDALPSVSSTYLSIRRILGDSRVGPTQMVLFNESDSKYFNIARNSWISLQEARAALLGAIWNVPQRALIDITHSDDDLQFQGPQLKKKIVVWREGARREITSEVNGFVGDVNFNDKDSVKMAAGAALRRIEKLKKDSRAAYDSSTASFEDLVTSEAKLQYLEFLTREWEGKLKGSF